MGCLGFIQENSVVPRRFFEIEIQHEAGSEAVFSQLKVTVQLGVAETVPRGPLLTSSLPCANQA